MGVAYVIVSVGTSTAANWQALGLPVGVTPAVGAVFIATSASAGTGTGVVQVMATAGAGVDHIEVVGDPNQTCNPSTGNAYLVCACFSKVFTYNSGTPANSTVTDGLAAPANNTVIGLTFNMLPNPGPRI